MPGGDAPDAPNYNKLARIQGEEDRKTAQAITLSNRPQQNTLGGQIDWTLDPTTNKWTQNVTVDPAIQAQFGQLQDLSSAKTGDLMNQGAYTPPSLDAFDVNSGRGVGDALYASVMDRARPEQAREMERFTTQLRQQGLVPGSEAYDRAMRNLMTSQGDVMSQAALEARIRGDEEARKNYGTYLAGQNQEFSQYNSAYKTPWDIANAAQGLQGGQYMPQFTGVPGATGYDAPDLAGAAQRGYEANMGEYSAGQNQLGSLLGAGVSLATTFGPSLMAAFSDARLKTNIEKLGSLPNGIGVYEYDILGRHEVGVIAQEVLTIKPDAVTLHENGFYMVNYGKLQ